MRTSLDGYRIFEACARLGSFSLAAKELFITQPAVSQAMIKLEDNLGTPLFTRSTAGAALTDEGKSLYANVLKALKLIDGAEQELLGYKTLDGGSLNIGASDTLCRYFLLGHLELFHSLYPKVAIQVTNRTSGETVELLRQGKVQLGFVNLPTPVKSGLLVREIAQVQDCFVCGERYRHLCDEPAFMDTIAEYPLLMLEELSSSRRFVQEHFRQYGVELSPQIELGSLDLLLEFASIGLGVAAVVKEFAADFLEKGKLFELPVTPPIKKRGIGLVYHRDVPLSYAAKAFLKLMNIE